jgi:hypothetical protein
LAPLLAAGGWELHPQPPSVRTTAAQASNNSDFD